MPPFHDLQKHFFPGDTGITVCTYPNGKLGNGMQYDTLVSIGFTYPVVAGLILDRNLDDAEAVAKDIRGRHDGRNRSPWNEPECGNLYSRAMAAWNLFDQAVGVKYDSTSAAFSFDPRYSPESFQCFFIAETGWGEFKQSGPAGLPSGSLSMKVLHGNVNVRTLIVASSATKQLCRWMAKPFCLRVSQEVQSSSPSQWLSRRAPFSKSLSALQRMRHGTSWNQLRCSNLEVS